MFLYILAFVFVIIGAIFVFLHVYPAFGGNPNHEQVEKFQFLPNYGHGKFQNRTPAMLSMGVKDFFSMMKDSMVGKKTRSPKQHLPVAALDGEKVNGPEDSITWFGHSTILLSIDQKKILIDPMFGPAASPVTFVGSKRYSQDMLPVIDDLPMIDAVFLTHDHYDHLDYPSIKRLAGKVGHYVVPLGVGAHLIRWGVDKDSITELNWWDEVEFRGLKVALAPSKHFSGRGLFNRDSTLWGGWVILGQQTRFYISGDGGYDTHFTAIGEKYGPFDIALIEGGQYDKRWPGVHMTPEEAVQAHLDVKGKNMMLVHWGAFTLAFHGWSAPIDRAIAAAEKANVTLVAPKLGETMILDQKETVPLVSWWAGK